MLHQSVAQSTSSECSQSKHNLHTLTEPQIDISRVLLPALKQVSGGFNLQSTKDITKECSHFRSISGSTNVIRGTYTCAGKLDEVGGTGSLPGGTNAGGGGASGASSLAISGAAGVLTLVALVFGML